MPQDGKVVVYLAASEEAVWDVDNSWTWDTPIGEITDMISEFDTTLNAVMVNVIGSGF